jgi:hypothetical protein
MVFGQRRFEGFAMTECSEVFFGDHLFKYGVTASVSETPPLSIISIISVDVI